jgi:sec-independent protein translocase protein TatC
MGNKNQKDMGFLDHLEELRWRLIKTLAAILVGAIISFIFIDYLIELLLLPTKKIETQFDLQVLKVQGMFVLKWGLAMVTGLILAIPVLTYQIWKFVVPGLYAKERKYFIPLMFFTFLAFLCGVLFAYIVMIPVSLRFFTSMGYADVANNISINYYFSYVTWLMLGAGLIFELPVLSFILSSIGLLSPAFLRTYRRHSIIIIMIVAAFITPPDPVSLILMTVPLIVLYEISIGVSALATKKRSTEQKSVG